MYRFWLIFTFCMVTYMYPDICVHAMFFYLLTFFQFLLIRGCCHVTTRVLLVFFCNVKFGCLNRPPPIFRKKYESGDRVYSQREYAKIRESNLPTLSLRKANLTI